MPSLLRHERDVVTELEAEKRLWLAPQLDNIMVHGPWPHPQLRICDFGFSKLAGSACNTLCGTPEYMAPEVIFDPYFGGAADMWCVALSRCGASAFDTRYQHRFDGSSGQHV